MTDADARLSALLAYPAPPRTDPAFADRVVALAAHDLAARRARRRGFAQIAREALVLTAVLASFALLARAEPMLAGAGDSISVGGPAMVGLLALLMWTLVGGSQGAIVRIKETA